MIHVQPIPKDHIKESVKKNEAITLRSQPLNSILTYSLEDSSERVFEASITAEMVKSAISVSYANTVTDFLLADYITLQHLADPR